MVFLFPHSSELSTSSALNYPGFLTGWLSYLCDSIHLPIGLIGTAVAGTALSTRSSIVRGAYYELASTGCDITPFYTYLSGVVGAVTSRLLTWLNAFQHSAEISIIGTVAEPGRWSEPSVEESITIYEFLSSFESAVMSVMNTISSMGVFRSQ